VPSARDPEAIYRIFGRRLRELRDGRGIAQEELATLSGLTRSSIANIENGKQRVLLHQLVQFAEALHTNVGELIPIMASGPSEPAPVKVVDAEAHDEKIAYLARVRSLMPSNLDQEQINGHEDKS
jgi:transcriptional regulator with XRE-family HTH domain